MLKPTLIGAALAASIGAAAAHEAKLSREVYACTQWAGWHEYTMASLTPKGASANKYCPIRIKAGAKVEVSEDNDGSGAATVQYQGKTWVIDADAVE
jgi:hypothetical protein